MKITRGKLQIQLTKEELSDAWMEYQQILNKEEDTARKKAVRQNLESQGLIKRIPIKHLDSALDAIVEHVRDNETEYGSDPEYEMTERLEDILDSVLISMEYNAGFSQKTSVVFSSTEEMLKTVQDDVDLYNVLTGEYIFKYNEAGSIAVYDVSLEEAKKLEEESQISNEYWGAYLGVGGNIYDDPSEYCREKYNIAGWIDVTPGH